MVQFLGCRLLERGHLATLWIDTIEHALDGAVLAGGIHALEDEEQRPAVLRVQLLLKIGQPLAVGIQDRLTLFLVEAALGVGLVGVEMKFIGAVDTERRDVGIELGAQRPRMLLAHGRPTSVTSTFPPSFDPSYAVRIRRAVWKVAASGTRRIGAHLPQHEGAVRRAQRAHAETVEDGPGGIP